MSRHRNVRSMNYHDEYDGYDDVYGHSVEDGDFCVSPGTAHYLSSRHDQPSMLSAFMMPDKIKEEDENSEEDGDEPLHDPKEYKRPALDETDEARLNSCLEEIRNIIGESTPEHILVEAVLSNNFHFEKSLNAILTQQDAPKEQRELRQRRDGGVIQPQGPIQFIQSSTKAPFELKTPPKPRRPSPQPDKTDTDDRLAKMTIASNKKVASGFTPEGVGGKRPPDDREKMETEQGQGSFEVSPVNSLAATPKKDRDVMDVGGASAAAPKIPHVSSSNNLRAKMDKDKLLNEYTKRNEGTKSSINMVVIGHVDAGKSTLMGHVLFQLGFVNKKVIHKYEQESKKQGKASFAFAWVLDETEEERSRGVTMDVAQTRFDTESKSVTLLDAPGHKDFIPNMITGASQADVAILVVNATRGEFETGFETGGQTREHAMLIRSLGVSQLCVAVNKMDTVHWNEERYEEITKKLGSFLKTAGFRESDVSYIPCSGLKGENLTKPTEQPILSSWYSGPTLIHQIDQFKPPERMVQKAFRMVISDVFKGMGAGFSVSGNIQAGAVQPGDKLLIMPQTEPANVRSVTQDDVPMLYGFAGDNVVLTVTGVDQQLLSIGSILCDPSNPIQVTSRVRARVVIFNIDVPLTQGFPVVFHYGAASEPAHIKKLVSQLHKTTGEVVRKRPRCLTKNSNAVIEVELSRPICIELYKDYKDLGRFMLRYSGATIAAGLVTEILKPKPGRNE